MTTETPTETPTEYESIFTKRVKVCPTCKTDDFTSTKFHSPLEEVRSNFQTHFCHRCRDLTEPVWLCAETHTRHAKDHPLLIIESLQEEVAWLTKRLKRHEAAEDARAAAIAATAGMNIDGEKVQDTAATDDAADFYGSFGRDEWPTR